LLLAGAALLGLPPAGAAQEAAGPVDVQAKAREILADPRYQSSLPPHGGVGRLDEPGGRPVFSGSGPSPAVVPVIGAGAALGKVLFIVLLVVIVVLALGWLVQSLPVWKGREAVAEGGQASDAPAPEEPEPQFEDAARLAAEGRYAEAVHALLLAAIRHFAERSRVAIQPSRTSRELVRLLPLGPDTREAFAELVRMVELSLFGGAPVSAEDYERSLTRFRALTRRPA
jgi:hypothetical protein